MVRACGSAGNGIPQNIIDKIFHLFFTSKTTMQGTDLGLSLAYDIITKQHYRTIKAMSSEGKASPDDLVGWGSTFAINLPV